MQYRLNYGISHDDYDRLYAQQQGRCCICDEFHSRLCVDHDHKTGRVRGLLCRSCNSGLGFFRDQPRHLRQAINYLEADG